MFGFFKKEVKKEIRNIYRDLEELENEIARMSASEVIAIMMKLSNISSINSNELKKHTFILISISMKKLGYNVENSEDRQLLYAIDDCACRVRDNILTRLSSVQ